MKTMFKNLLLVAFLVALASCKPTVPSDILSEGKMEDILYDYHVALAMAQNDPGEKNANAISYREAVLKKYDVTPAEFDTAMVYYMRHTALLHSIYEKLADRLNKEAMSMGASSSDMSKFANLSSTGDTANVWNAAKSMVFSADKPFNYESYSLVADTAFHKGDRMMLDFDAQFIYQDGMRDGIAVLAIQFKNDSVASQVIHVQNSQHYSITVSDNDSLGIKSVKGYFMLNKGDFSNDMSSATTLKLMFVQNIKLIRMHAQKAKPQDVKNQGDSLKTAPVSPQPRGGALPPPDRPIKMEMESSDGKAS